MWESCHPEAHNKFFGKLRMFTFSGEGGHKMRIDTKKQVGTLSVMVFAERQVFWLGHSSGLPNQGGQLKQKLWCSHIDLE